MKKVAKAILMAGGVLFVVVTVIVVLGVNLYVQSAGTRARIERGLSKGLHTNVKIGGVSFMPWYGVKISGIARDEEGPPDGNTVQIADISVRLRLLQLMRHEVVIKELTVQGVKVEWTQNPEGKWLMPPLPAPPPEAIPVAPQPAAPPPPAEKQERRPVIVDHARLRDGSFVFYDAKHRPLASFTGVNVQTPSPADKRVEGTAAIGNVAIQKMFYITDWRGSFLYTPEEVSLFNTVCTVASGTATGTLDVKIAERNSPFVLDTRFSDVSLKQLLADAGVTQAQASGMLSGYVHLEGNSRDSSTARGTGRIVLSEGEVSDSVLFDSLGLLLGTTKFRKLALDDAHAIFHVGGGKVVLDDLTLKSAVLSLTSKGGMATDGSGLLLDCRLSISADVARQVGDYLLQNFGKDESTGARFVDFPVTGDINHPHYGFLDAVRKHINSKDAIFNYLGLKLGGHEPASQPAAEPPSPSPQPTATPAPTP